MFIPEYTITAKTLKNIASIEYGKAIIDSIVVLQNWERQIQTQTLVDSISANLQLEGLAVSDDVVKKAANQLLTNPPIEVSNFKKAFDYSIEASKHRELNEETLKYINTVVTNELNTKKSIYRSNNITGKTLPEEILAEVVELFDWLNSMDARDTHPVVAAAITKARLEEIVPFESFNTTTANIMTNVVLQTVNYSFRNFVDISIYYNKGQKEYFKLTAYLTKNTNDFTQWLEYFSQGYAMQVATTQEKVKLLARDTKVAKATGRVRLTQRQEKIVEYLQDYGLIQNKDFPKLFPEKSEDSILRDLKVLIDLGIIQKAGSTKSSRYELK